MPRRRRWHTQLARRDLTTVVTWLIATVVVLACVGWAVAVELLVPDACTYPVPPPNAQYLHCS